jgi:hypothetical protein
MSIDRSVTSSSGQILVLTVWDVEVSLGVAVLLGQTEINDIDLVTTLTNAHQEIVWLDVTVDEGFGVDVLDTGNELICEEQDGLQGELAVAEVEKILQTGTKKIKDHCIVVTLGPEPADKRNSDASSERLVDTSLILKLRVFGLDALELDSDLLARDDVGSKVNITKTTATNFAANTVFVADTKILHGRISTLVSSDICLCYSSCAVNKADGLPARG